MDFKTYLQKEGFSISTIVTHILRIEHFTKWLRRKRIKQEETTYSDIINYASYLQKTKGYQRNSTNNELRAVKLYYDYLINEARAENNPAENVAIRGQRKKIVHNTLGSDELEDLYYSYKTDYNSQLHRAAAVRNKTIVGLLAYQGLTPNDVYRVKEEHLQLNKGRIYVPRGRRSNGRTLELKAWQMMDFLTYIEEHRHYLSKRIQADHSEQLYHGSTKYLQQVIWQIVKQLKATNQKVRTAGQLRASVMVNWLKQYNLRKVQVMAGHRYISSTEKFLQNDIESLHEMVNQFHPMR